jgi:hypothetical protein
MSQVMMFGLKLLFYSDNKDDEKDGKLFQNFPS